MYSAKLRLRLVVEYLVVIIYSTVLRARRTGLALVVGFALSGLAQVEELSNRREGTVIGFSANADVQDATANMSTQYVASCSQLAWFLLAQSLSSI